MNQNKIKFSATFKHLTVSVVFSFVLFFVLQAVFAAFLPKLDHYEKYYNIASYLTTVLLSLFVSLVLQKTGSNRVFLSFCSALIVSLLFLSFALIFLDDQGHFSSVVFRFVLFVILSPVFSFLFGHKKRLNRSKKTKFRFQR